MTHRPGQSQLIVATLLASVGLLGCAPQCPDTKPPASGQSAAPRPPSTIDPNAPLCDSLLARDRPHKTPCRLIGVYALTIRMNSLGAIQDAWPAVFREGVGWVLLESLWNPETRPAPAEIASYEGKQVEVYGIPHYNVPAPGPANYVHLPCIAPVYAIRVIADSPDDDRPPANVTAPD